jgi:hypothetical protein
MVYVRSHSALFKLIDPVDYMAGSIQDGLMTLGHAEARWGITMAPLLLGNLQHRNTRLVSLLLGNLQHRNTHLVSLKYGLRTSYQTRKSSLAYIPGAASSL